MVTKESRLLVLAIPIIVNSCSAPQRTMDVSPIQTVTDWTGLQRLSRSGDLYFGGQPTREGIDSAPQRGVKMIVNLRSEEEVASLGYDEPALVRQLGMEYVAIPVTPETFGPDHADRLQAALAKSNGPVLIHCASANRVGAVWALYLNRHRSVPLDEAIELGRKAGMRSDALAELVRKHAQ